MSAITEINDPVTITNILNRAFMPLALQFNFTKETVPRFPAFIGPDVIEKQLGKGLEMFGFRIDEKTTACVGYSYYKDRIYFIERLATLPEYRHRGIGKALMEFAEQKIRECGGTQAEIHVVDRNELLIEWYRKLGYIQIRIDELSGKAGKMPFNSCVMNKAL